MSRLTKSQAQNLLRLYHASGLSQLAFRKKHNLGTSLFAYWLPRCEALESSPKATFQEIALPQVSHSPANCTLTFSDGIKLTFPATQINSVIAALTNGCREC
jgi:uncharacterized protein with NAD-binding domain and iron-sulfur cluster